MAPIQSPNGRKEASHIQQQQRLPQSNFNLESSQSHSTSPSFQPATTYPTVSNRLLSQAPLIPTPAPASSGGQLPSEMSTPLSQSSSRSTCNSNSSNNNDSSNSNNNSNTSNHSNNDNASPSTASASLCDLSPPTIKRSSVNSTIQFTQRFCSPPSPQHNSLPFSSSSTSSLVTQPSTPPCKSPVPPSSKSSHSSSLITSVSGADLTREPGWQAEKKSASERGACLFNNELYSDVTLVVGPPASNGGGPGDDEAVECIESSLQQRIPAHKVILASSSEVFEAMFYGKLKIESTEIEIPDVEADAFCTLLKYIYSDAIDLNNDTVLSTLYASKKYIIPHLSKACVDYLESNLSAKNACILLSHSRLFDEASLTSRCWEVIDAQAEIALTSDQFADIDYQTLKCILERDTLNCKELTVFNAVDKWSEEECLRKGLEKSSVTASEKRKVIKDAIYLIRIPTMTLNEFANGPAQSGMLTLAESNDLFLYYTADTKPVVPFSNVPRKGLPIETCHRFQSSAYRSNQWRYRGRCDSIQFTVDKRIFVKGYGLYGSSSGSADYTVKLELKKIHNGLITNLAEKYTKFHSNGSSDTFHVYFDDPIQIEPDQMYIASAVLEGSELSYFGQDGLSEVTVQCATNSSVTFQFQGSSDSTNGTGVQGGQLPEILFYAPRS